jgi:hypothetical protein
MIWCPRGDSDTKNGATCTLQVSMWRTLLDVESVAAAGPDLEEGRAVRADDVLAGDERIRRCYIAACHAERFEHSGCGSAVVKCSRPWTWGRARRCAENAVKIARHATGRVAIAVVDQPTTAGPRLAIGWSRSGPPVIPTCPGHDAWASTVSSSRSAEISPDR